MYFSKVKKKKKQPQVEFTPAPPFHPFSTLQSLCSKLDTRKLTISEYYDKYKTHLFFFLPSGYFY